MQRVSGFGFALLATPLLASAMPVSRAVIVVSLVAFPSGVLNWRLLGVHADRSQVRRLVMWSCPGMLVGLLAHSHLPDHAFRIVLSAAIGVAAVVTASGWRIRSQKTGWADAISGFLSGVLNTSTGTNGPPLVVSLSGQHLTADAFRGTLAGVFTLSGAVAIALFAVDGLITRRILVLAAYGIPVVFAGRTVGGALAERISEQHFRHLVVGLLFVTAIVGLANALL